jgi:hypothetical protein
MPLLAEPRPKPSVSGLDFDPHPPFSDFEMRETGRKKVVDRPWREVPSGRISFFIRDCRQQCDARGGVGR